MTQLITSPDRFATWFNAKRWTDDRAEWHATEVNGEKPKSEARIEADRILAGRDAWTAKMKAQQEAGKR